MSYKSNARMEWWCGKPCWVTNGVVSIMPGEESSELAAIRWEMATNLYKRKQKLLAPSKKNVQAMAHRNGLNASETRGRLLTKTTRLAELSYIVSAWARARTDMSKPRPPKIIIHNCDCD